MPTVKSVYPRDRAARILAELRKVSAARDALWEEMNHPARLDPDGPQRALRELDEAIGSLVKWAAADALRRPRMGAGA